MVGYRRKIQQWHKPPLGSQIDWNHPLAQGLVACFILNEGTGRIVFDPINRIRLTSSLLFPNVLANSKWEGGLVLNDDGAAFKVTTPQVLKLSFPITVVWQGYNFPTYHESSNAFYFGCSYSNSTFTPTMGYGLKIGISGNSLYGSGTVVAGTNNGTLDKYTPYEGLFPRPRYNQIAAVFGAPNHDSIRLFVQGNVVQSVNPILPIAPTYLSDSTFGFGNIISAGSVNIKTINTFGLVYNIAMEEVNLVSLSEQPYAYFLPTMSRRYFFPVDRRPIILGYRESDFNAGIIG